MSFILDTLENMLSLSPTEKATFAAAQPTLAKWVTLLNAQWDTLQDLLNWLFRSQPVVNRLLTDGKVLGPIVQDVLTDTDNIMEAPTAMNMVNDVKAVINANPVLLAALNKDWAKLQPLVAQVQGDLQKPEIQAALALLQTKMGAQGVKMHQVLEHVIKEYIE